MPLREIYTQALSEDLEMRLRNSNDWIIETMSSQGSSVMSPDEGKSVGLGLAPGPHNSMSEPCFTTLF